MSMYAYKDNKRSILVYAQSALKQDRDNWYYCPNPKCNAKMYLCGVEGESTAYFSANRKGAGHIEGCVYFASNTFNPNNIDESSFNFQTFFENILSLSVPTVKMKYSNSHKTGDSSLKPLRTLRQIYDMCKSYECTHKYNNQEIKKMLLDDRSEYFYTRGVFGNRIIEAKAKNGEFYNPKKLELYLVAPSSKKYTFILKVPNEKLFRKLSGILFNNRDKFVVVAGKWEPSDKSNVFKANVNSEKQIKIV